MANADFIDYQILLNATQAVKELRTLSQEATTFKQRLDLAKASVKKFSDDTGMSLRNTASAFKSIDESLAKTTNTSTVFGSESKEGWNQAGMGAERFTKRIEGVGIAMSILAYDLVRTGLQAIKQFFTQSINKAKELESSLYRLKSAERILSNEGINISMEGFKKGIQDIKKLLPIFSEKDITEMVGALAISTKQLGFTEKQILDLAKAAAIYNVQSVENETLLQSQSKLVTALISPQAKSIAEYGIAFSKVTMTAKALELGILHVGESVAKLTDAQKAQVKYAIIMEGAEKNIAGLNDFMETNTAKIEKNKAAWEDLQTTVGQVLLPFLPAITSILDFLKKALDMSKLFITIWAAGMGTVANTWRALKSGEITIKNLVEYAKFAFKNLREEWLRALFPDIPANASPFFKKILENAGVGKFKDTPTAAPAPEPADSTNLINAQKETEDKLSEIMKDSRDKRLDIERDYQQKLQDIALNYSQKLQDIAINESRKEEDALADLNKKIEDVNSNSAKSIQTAKQESRNKDIENERKYQQDLKDLQHKFLMDLEEALHARDARAILRLIQQHNLEKQKLEENKKTQDQQAQAELVQKLKNIEEERKAKIEAAKKEYADKLKEIHLAAQREAADAAIANQRALNDARIAHNRQLEEQRLYLQRKLRDLADAIAKEYNLTAAGQAAIASLLGISSTATPSTGSLFTSSTPVTSSTWAQGGLFGTGGMAEGGTFLATRPQTINVAENRPEIISATPLGRPGADVNKMFSNASMGGGASSGGQMEIGLTLSPDLESRIIRNTLDETAKVVVRVNRSRV